MVNLEWYRTFKAVYQNGTLTKAANDLLISQPSISVQISSLESYIGHPLFIRHPRRMEPTEYGKRLYTQVVEALDNLEKVETEFKRSVLRKSPTIRFGTPPEIFQTYMAPNLKHLEYNIDVQFGMASQLLKSLRSNELDIAIITKQDKLADGLHYEPVLTETFKIISGGESDTFEFGGDLEKTEKWLKNQIWYSYDSDLPAIRRFWKNNFNKRPILNVKAVIPDNNALLEAVVENNALIVSSDLIAKKALERGVAKILWDGVNPTVNTLYLSYYKDKIPKELLEAVKNYINISFPENNVIH